MQNTREPIFDQNTLLNLSLLFCAMLSIMLMVIDQRTNKLVPIKETGATLLYPILWIAQTPIDTVGKIGAQFNDYETLLKENKEYQQRQLLINVNLQKMASIEAENQRLRTLLKASVDLDEPSLVAEILSVDLDPYRNIVLLNRGKRENVLVGQAIIDPQGVVGQIIEVSEFSSKAILIADPMHLIPIQVNRNGVRGLAAGIGNLNALEIRNIQMHEKINADIQKGDLLVTSGLDGRFPAGHPVAIVETVEYDVSRPFAKITAKPTVALDRIREVLILKKIRQQPTVYPPTTVDTKPVVAEADPSAKKNNRTNARNMRTNTPSSEKKVIP